MKNIISANPTAKSSNTNFFRWAIYYGKTVALPILLAIIPTLYHYSNNVKKLTFTSLFRMLVFNMVVALIVYVICLVITRFQPFKAALAASVFLIFFNIYGLVYQHLMRADVMRIQHYTLLPLFILFAVYASWLMIHWKSTILVSLWKNFLLVVSVLVLFNLIQIIPAEIKKWNNN